jgi:hypothetical protein
MMLAVVVDSATSPAVIPPAIAEGLLDASLDGGVIAENDGESLGSVKPPALLGLLVASAVLPTGGTNGFVVDGVVRGAVGDTIESLPGSA